MLSVIIDTVVSISNALAVAELAVQGLKAVVGLLVNVAKALGLVETLNEDTAEKALQAEDEGIKPENFDSYDEYLNAIDEFEVDPEKKHTEQEKIEKQIELLADMILEKNPDMPISDMVRVVGSHQGYLNEVRLSEIGKVCGGDARKMSEVIGLLNGTEKNVIKLDNAEKTMITVEKNLNPSLSDADALKQINCNI